MLFHFRGITELNSSVIVLRLCKNDFERPIGIRNGEHQMPLMQLVIILIVVGVLLWLVNRFIPMQSSIKSILNGVVVIAVVVWIANLFGLFAQFSKIHVGR